MESRHKSGKPVSVTDSRREAEFLKSTDKLSSLEEVLAAVAEAKETYRQRLQDARKRPEQPRF